MRSIKNHTLGAICSIASALLLLSSASCAPETAYGNAVEGATHAESPAEPEASTYRGLTDEERSELSALAENASLAFETYDEQASNSFEYEVREDGGIAIKKYIGNDIIVVVPEKIDEKPVLEIGDGAFRDSSVRALSLPNGVASIGKSAFEGCANLATLKMPIVSMPGNGSLGYAFGAEDLAENTKKVPAALSMIILTDGPARMQDNYLYNFKSLRAAVLPSSTEHIGNLTFFGCEKLFYLGLPQNLISIGEYAFGECKSLAALSLDLPRLEKIGLGAFHKCQSIKELTIPFVGGGNEENAFLSYIFGAESPDWSYELVPQKLGRVVITGGNTIDNKAFYKCSSISEIILPNSLESIGIRSFYGCVSIREIAIPDNVRSIGDDAFFGCTNLENVSMNSSISVGMQAFYGTKYEINTQK